MRTTINYSDTKILVNVGDFIIHVGNNHYGNSLVG